MSTTNGSHADLVGLLDRRAALREAARRARAVTGADISLVGQIEEDGVAVVRSWAGTRCDGLHNLVVPSGLGLGGKVLATSRPISVRHYARSRSITHHFDEPIEAEGIKAMLGVPVHRNGRLIGMIYAARRERGDFGATAVSALTGIADATATALTVADLAEAQREAETRAERRRIAVELHDSVGAMLFAIGAQVRDLLTDEDTSPALAERLGSVEQRLTEASSALRRSLAALSEPAAQCSLPTTVAGDCRAFQERTGVAARAVTLTPLPELDAQRCRTVLSAIREALLNVEKHAGASSVVVSLAASDGSLTAVVADDGSGWIRRPVPSEPGGEALPAGGIGLAAVEERLGRIGGTLQIFGNDDTGLTVRIRIPCP